jgi:branched-chain amino acid aminotransferase
MNKHSAHIWANGKLIPWDEAKVHVMCHALHYGTGVFEGIRAYETDRGPAIFRLPEHVARFFDSAKVYNFAIPFTPGQISQACVDVVAASGMSAVYVRPLAFWGYGKFGLHATGLPIEVYVASWEWERYLGDEGLDKGIKATISPWRKFAPDALPPAAKASGQYLSSILSGNDARRRGYDEAILLDHRGFVAEGCGENVFLVKDGVLITNDVSSSILPGITRASILELARDLGIPVTVKDIAPSELLLADEVFFTGTAAEVTPVREINDRTIGSGKRGPVTLRIQTEFMNVVKGRNAKYHRWLTWAVPVREKKASAGKRAAVGS